MDIKYNINSFKDKLSPAQCKLIAVSKRKPNSDILAAYDAGQRDFGENKVQELLQKVPDLPADIRWHMIGHLQRNKVKSLVPFIHMIHSVDSDRLLAEIEKQAAKSTREIPCLLQVFIAKEETKFGLSDEEILELIDSDLVKGLKWTKIIGLMGMATYTDDKEQIRGEFRGLKQLFEQIKERSTPASVEMRELSMGMTDDYEIAIEEGSTIIRVGSAIFGPREY